MTLTGSSAGQDSNLKKPVNTVNFVSLLLLPGNTLRGAAENGKRKQIQSLSPLFLFTKFTSSQGFLRCESGEKPVENELNRGVRGDYLDKFGHFAGHSAATVFYTGVLIEHLLTLMIVRRVFVKGEITPRGHGRKFWWLRCELASESVNFHF
jgi:hypothetical protein